MLSSRDPVPHEPVLYHEIISFLRPHSGGRYVDCTLGSGGHAWGILGASHPDGLLLGLDIDPYALEMADQHLGLFSERVKLVRASYVTLKQQIKALGWEHVNGILFDLGISSMQIDVGERGFSFQREAVLDMRFDPDGPVTAQHLVNTLTERELAELLYRFGEEHQARRIAKAIVESRPIKTTSQLAEIVSAVQRRKKNDIHPATRTFQALRIAVNRELEALETALPQAIYCLAPQGRLAVISYHSLEDRLVKKFFQLESRDCICPPEQPVCTCGHQASVKVITRKPVRPSREEVARNPRARSARLRVAERL